VSATEASRNPIKTAREVAARAVRLAKLELELRTVGLKSKATRLGAGAGLGLLALLLAPLVVVFGLATLAAALATWMHVWLAILIVTGVLLLLIIGLAGTAALLIRKALKGDGDAQR
jgi:uncharacterized membrane protein YqjE